MKLTNEEQQERGYLLEIKQGYKPMMQKDFDRLKYFNDKESHNVCPNPHCIGYEGKEVEIFCPKCKKTLMKTLKLCTNCEHCVLDDNRIGEHYYCGVTEDEIEDIEQDGCEDNYESV